MIHAQAFRLVERNQNAGEEQLVLLFQRQGKTVDDRSENFQEFRDTVESLRLVGELEEHVANRPSDI